MGNEPYRSNIRHFLEAGVPRCILCSEVVGQPFSMHICPVETRIREIVREELNSRSAQSEELHHE